MGTTGGIVEAAAGATALPGSMIGAKGLMMTTMLGVEGGVVAMVETIADMTAMIGGIAAEEIMTQSIALRADVEALLDIAIEARSGKGVQKEEPKSSSGIESARNCSIAPMAMALTISNDVQVLQVEDAALCLSVKLECVNGDDACKHLMRGWVWCMHAKSACFSKRYA